MQVLLNKKTVTLSSLRKIGIVFAQALKSGDLVYLCGPLGVGKTALVRFIAQALEVTDLVRSPSFTIANTYSGGFLDSRPIVVHHLDLYRLDKICEDDALALEEFQNNEAITFVEWPQVGEHIMGMPHWVVVMEHCSLNERSVLLKANTKEAAERWRQAKYNMQYNQ